MRQIFFILSVVFFTFYMASPVMAEEVSEIMLGDVNNNGKIDIGDAVCIVNYMYGNENASFYETMADVNSDNKINISDCVSIVNIMYGNNASSRGVEVDDEEEMQDPD